MKRQAHLANRLKPEWFTTRDEDVSRPEASHVLVADDHAGIRLGFRTALEVAGYEVTEAEDGDRALEILRRDKADLALLDLRMPGLDGMEVLRRLREEAIDVPVVIVTAHGDIAGALRAVEFGAFDFLSKPVEPATLRETVFGALLQRARVGTEAGSKRPSPTSLGALAHRFAETLAVARRALQHGHFDLAEYLLEQALDIAPDSAEANALRGTLHEDLGEHHAAYQAYRRALSGDVHHRGAREGMRRYCERFGIDTRNKAVNPGAD